MRKTYVCDTKQNYLKLNNASQFRLSKNKGTEASLIVEINDMKRRIRQLRSISEHMTKLVRFFLLC